MTPDDRARLGAWYTPPELVATVVAHALTDDFVTRRQRPVRVLDPACGDGRFLAAVAALGLQVELTGVDIDPAAVRAAESLVPGARFLVADAVTLDWQHERFDVVIGNPPFLSPLSTRTARDAIVRRDDVGPYADAAVEFLALATDLVDPDGGRVAFVLPQSMLASRDAARVRDRMRAASRIVWSWVGDEAVFDAQVLTCAIVFEFGGRGGAVNGPPWSAIVNRARAIPNLPVLDTAGTIGDRCRVGANFRDEYYGMLPAIVDGATTDERPALVTSGLIDPARNLWGERPVRVGGRQVRRPVVDVARLDDRMRRWASSRLVPKVLVANQTRIVEAVADPEGAWLPGVPVISIVPDGPTASVHEVAAVLTSPTASLWVWHRMGGTGRSAGAVRLSPSVLADLPWPGGSLDDAVAALCEGDVRSCARAVEVAFGVRSFEGLEWWLDGLDRIERRQPDA